jgi:energy-coupling factor transporter ATP-binding protein EcfA2
MEDDKELNKVMDEAENTPINTTEEDKTQAKILVDFVLNSEAKLFHDQFDNAFIAINGDGSKILKLKSRGFKTWLSHKGWEKLDKAIASATIETAVRTLEGYAIHKKEEIKLHVRIAGLDGKIYYDLGESKTVEIDEDEWQIITPSPILFYNFSHQRPQVTPVGGEALTKIYDFIPSPQDKRQKLLLLVWLVAAIMPDFPHPILLIHGPQGSRKTTLSKLLRRLIDPSIMETLTASGDNKEYVQLASHHYLLPLDNLSNIKPEFSDILCRTVTGEGMSKRELYTDDDDIIYSFRRVVAMNGINLVVSKPDLLERSLIIELERPSVYQEEAKMLSKFDEVRPQLLGALFDTASASMDAFKKIEMPKQIGSFRMADFVRWGCAISHVLGYKAEDFIGALVWNLERQNAEAIEDSPIAQVVIDFMAERTNYSESPTVLFKELRNLAENMNIDVKQRAFPKNPNWLWRKLEIVSTNLLAFGIKIEKDKQGARRITITKTGKSAVNAVSGVQSEQRDKTDMNF